MKVFSTFTNFLLCLIATSLFFFSCDGQSSEVDSSVLTDSARLNENYRLAIKEQFSDIQNNENYKKAIQTQFLEINDFERGLEEAKNAYREEEERIIAEAESNLTEEDAAPYGYNQWGEPYASRDWKNLDEALMEFDKARLNYIKALDIRDPMAIMYYHQRMKLEIENCLYYANNIGDIQLINKLKEYKWWVDNLEY